MNKNASKMAMARTRARRMAHAPERGAADVAPEAPVGAAEETSATADAALEESLPEEAPIVSPLEELPAEEAPGMDAVLEAPPLEEASAFMDGDTDEPLPEEAPPPEKPEPARSSPLLMLVIDEEEEVEFCAPDVANDVSAAVAAPSESDTAEAEPPFDPPDLDELACDEETADEPEPPRPEEFCAEEVEADEAALQLEEPLEGEVIADEEPPSADMPGAAASENGEEPPQGEELLELDAIADDEEPPFDPMDVEELAPPSLSMPVASTEELVLAPANENARGPSLGPVRNAVPEGARDQPAPAIRIHLSWDRPEAADFFARVAADPRLSRTEITIARGGIDGAVSCAAQQQPDLLVIDTTLRGASMLASLDRLLEAAGGGPKIIVLGAVNDVTLLRELAHRGVDEYIVWPAKPEDVAGSACAMFAGTDKARVIAVVGARGGIGASTIAHNLAWSIAERQRARTTLIDLDLPFGAAAFNFKIEPVRSLGDVLDASEAPNDVALERVGARRTERLTILPAPANPRRSADLEAEAAQALIAAARRLSSFVVLDLPHLWAPWVKQLLLGADEILLVSSPDLASLRNTDNIAKLIKNERKTDPVVVLSMAGVPKRPEVPPKEFAEALGITPACAFAFEPNVYGAAAITGQMLGEIAPDSKMAALLDQLATLLTGRDPIDASPPEPSLFEPHEAAGAEIAPIHELEPEDPFEHALVNPFALQPTEDALEPEEAPVALAVEEQPPLELLEHEALEPDYMARARAAALEQLDAIETARPQPRRFGRLAGAAIGVAMAGALGVYFVMQGASVTPAPAPARASAEIEAPPPPPTPQQMAADYQAAAYLLDQGAATDAVSRLQRLADAGFAMAQYRLAKLYERGEGVAPDLVLARQWTERAAAAGNRNAIHDLGVYYARGEGAPRDDAAAFRLFEQAAELGFADSQFNLGVLYEQGRGVEANPGEALFWFMLAARQDDADAVERVAALRAALTRFEIEQAEARLALFQPTPADPVANGEFAPQSSESAASAEASAVPAETGG